MRKHRSSLEDYGAVEETGNKIGKKRRVEITKLWSVSGFLPFLFTSNPSKNTVTKKIEKFTLKVFKGYHFLKVKIPMDFNVLFSIKI